MHYKFIAFIATLNCIKNQDLLWESHQEHQDRRVSEEDGAFTSVPQEGRDNAQVVDIETGHAVGA